MERFIKEITNLLFNIKIANFILEEQLIPAPTLNMQILNIISAMLTELLSVVPQLVE
jgi:hypothetical protein